MALDINIFPLLYVTMKKIFDTRYVSVDIEDSTYQSTKA